MPLRPALRNLLQLWLLPLAVALLPWRLGWPLARFLTRLPKLYRREQFVTENGLRAAGFAPPDAGFLRRQRLLRLLDYSDLFLSMTRSDRWIARHIDVEGQWPAQGPFLVLTFHWGAGLWGLRHMHSVGVSSHSLSNELDPAKYAGEPFALAYDRLRNRETARVLGGPVHLRGSQVRHMLRALEDGENILGLIDVPVTDPRNAAEVQLLGRRARLPTGLLRIAQRCKAPVVAFWTGIDWATGRRRLVIRPPLRVDDVDAAARALAAELDPLLQQWPDHWHLWPVAADILGPAPDSPASD